MVQSDWAMQALADITGVSLMRPKVLESTALGVAALAGHRVGLYPSLSQENGDGVTQFDPRMEASDRDRLVAGWHRAVAATIAFSKA